MGGDHEATPVHLLIPQKAGHVGETYGIGTDIYMRLELQVGSTLDTDDNRNRDKGHNGHDEHGVRNRGWGKSCMSKERY